jgi:tripartite-type tricarboxylate transporter receptor subunit TctC
MRRRGLASSAGRYAALPWSEPLAQDYPARTVRMIVPLGAGGPTDLVPALADGLSNSLKQSFVVENRPGASGVIGTDAAAKAAPDGYTRCWSRHPTPFWNRSIPTSHTS